MLNTVHHASPIFGVLDLFVAGAGFDIAGAWWLARGLTTSPEKAAWLMIHSRNSFARFDVRSAEDYADGQIGRWSLIVGFLIQTLAYVLLAHGAKSLSHSPEALVGLVGCGTAAILLVFAVAHKAHPWLRDRWLVKFARIDNFGWVHALPSGRELFAFGQLVGKVPIGESTVTTRLTRCASSRLECATTRRTRKSGPRTTSPSLRWMTRVGTSPSYRRHIGGCGDSDQSANAQIRQTPRLARRMKMTRSAARTTVARNVWEA
jgi:hypothetical protein